MKYILRLFDKSLMYIKNNKKPRMEPCGGNPGLNIRPRWTLAILNYPLFSVSQEIIYYINQVTTYTILMQFVDQCSMPEFIKRTSWLIKSSSSIKDSVGLKPDCSRDIKSFSKKAFHYKAIVQISNHNLVKVKQIL